MTPHALLVLVALAGAGAWGAVLSLARSPTPQRRAAFVFALAVGQPLAVLLLSDRTAKVTGASTTLSSTAVTVGQAMNLAMLAASATLVLFPGEFVGRNGRLLLAGVWGMAVTLWLASVLSPDPGSARYAVYFATALTAVGVGVSDRITLARWIRRATRLIVSISLGAALVAPHWAFIGSGTRGYDRTLFGVPRLLGLSPHPNALSEVAAVALLLEFGFREGRTSTRWAAGVAAAICVVLTQSATGYLAAVIGLLTVLAVRNAAYRGVFASAALGLFGLIVFWPSSVLPTSVSGSDYVNSVSGRTGIWQLALDEWSRHPLFGYGPSIFSPDYLRTHFPPTLQQATNGHNQIVQTLADSGLVGATALTLVLWSLVLGAWRCRRADGGLLLGLVVVFMTFCMTETPLRAVGIVAVPALAVLGLVLAREREAVESSVDESLAKRGFAQLPPGLAALARR